MKASVRALAMLMLIVLIPWLTILALSLFEIPEGAPVLKLEDVIDLGGYGSVHSIALSDLGDTAISTGWYVDIITGNGTIITVNMSKLGTYASEITWYGRDLVVLGPSKTAIIDPWEKIVIAEADGAGSVAHLFVAGDYAVISTASFIRVYRLEPESIREVLTLGCEEIASDLGINLSKNYYLNVNTVATEDDRLVVVGVLAYSEYDSVAFLGVIDDGVPRFFSVDDAGLGEVTDNLYGAGAVSVGDLLIYYASSERVALINATLSGIEVLDMAELGQLFGGYCTGPEIGWAAAPSYAVLLGDCDLPIAGDEDYTVAYIVKRVGNDVVLDHTELLSNSILYGHAQNSGGPYIGLVMDGDLMHIFKLIITPPYPPVPNVFAQENDGVVTINATWSVGISGDVKGMIVDWGDGQRETYNTLIATHKYSSTGDYKINVTIVDMNGNTNSRMLLIKVREVQAITTTTSTTTTSAMTTTTTTTQTTTTETTTMTTQATTTTTAHTGTARTTIPSTTSGASTETANTTLEGEEAPPSGGGANLLIPIIAVIVVITVAITVLLIRK